MHNKNSENTYHPKEKARVSGFDIVGNYLKSLMSINYLNNGHCTEQEEHYFTDFGRRV
jgi:hypothetical protein